VIAESVLAMTRVAGVEDLFTAGEAGTWGLGASREHERDVARRAQEEQGLPRQCCLRRRMVARAEPARLACHPPGLSAGQPTTGPTCRLYMKRRAPGNPLQAQAHAAEGVSERRSLAQTAVARAVRHGDRTASRRHPATGRLSGVWNADTDLVRERAEAVDRLAGTRARTRVPPSVSQSRSGAHEATDPFPSSIAFLPIGNKFRKGFPRNQKLFPLRNPLGTSHPTHRSPRARRPDIGLP
jgi:hypothetical protein